MPSESENVTVTKVLLEFVIKPLSGEVISTTGGTPSGLAEEMSIGFSAALLPASMAAAVVPPSYQAAGHEGHTKTEADACDDDGVV